MSRVEIECCEQCTMLKEAVTVAKGFQKAPLKKLKLSSQLGSLDVSATEEQEKRTLRLRAKMKPESQLCRPLNYEKKKDSAIGPRRKQKHEIHATFQASPDSCTDIKLNYGYLSACSNRITGGMEICTDGWIQTPSTSQGFT